MKWTTAILSAISVSCSAVEKSKNPVEAGSVNWLRSYPDALKLAKNEQKPLLILFQEVPG